MFFADVVQSDGKSEIKKAKLKSKFSAWKFMSVV